MTQITVGMAPTKTQFQDGMKNRVRLKIIGTKQYLHLSGSGCTRGTDYAWVGTRAQARALRDRALSEDRAWPYTAVKAKGSAT